MGIGKEFLSFLGLRKEEKKKEAELAEASRLEIQKKTREGIDKDRKEMGRNPLSNKVTNEEVIEKPVFPENLESKNQAA